VGGGVKDKEGIRLQNGLLRKMDVKRVHRILLSILTFEKKMNGKAPQIT